MIDHARALAAQRLRASLADLAVAEHDRDFSAEHHVGRARDAVGQRVAAAIDVVELALRDRVVDVDRREQQRAGLHHFDRDDARPSSSLPRRRGSAANLRPAPWLRLEFVRSRSRITPHSSGRSTGIERGDLAGLLELRAFVHEQRGVAAVIEHERRAGAVGPHQRLLGAPPVLVERFAFPREHRRALRVRRRCAGLGGRRRPRPPHDPASRKCCRTPSARRRRARRAFR